MNPFYGSLFNLFNREHTALHTARMNGSKWREYHPLLLKANNETRLFGMMKVNWHDAPIASGFGDPII